MTREQLLMLGEFIRIKGECDYSNCKTCVLLDNRFSRQVTMCLLYNRVDDKVRQSKDLKQAKIDLAKELLLQYDAADILLGIYL